LAFSQAVRGDSTPQETPQPLAHMVQVAAALAQTLEMQMKLVALAHQA
jgi:hypothetical protein